MKKWIINILKYSLFMSISVGLFIYVYREQDFEQTFDNLLKVEYKWVLLSIAASLLSHISRAWRWTIALKPLGHHPRVFTAFLAVMFGYAANLFVPRIGEVARCSLLKRTDAAPISKSFGAVVAERFVDLMMLGVMALIALILEYSKITAFISINMQDTSGLWLKIMVLVGILLLLAATGVIIYQFRHQLSRLRLYDKIVVFLRGIRDGLFSIKRMSYQAKVAYLLHSIFIWIMYYYMAYLLVFSMSETAHLPAASGVTMLVMSAFAMVLPTPAGIGSYHYLVMITLSFFYQIDQTIGADFALLMHGSQYVTVLIVGLLSLLVSIPFKPIVKNTNEVVANTIR